MQYKNTILSSIIEASSRYRSGRSLTLSIILLFMMMGISEMLSGNSCDAYKSGPVYPQYNMGTAAGHSAMIYIDASLPQAHILAAGVAATGPDTYHLFSHGRPGQLLIEGQWLSSTQIVKWLQKKNIADDLTQLNIYGCEFAQGEQGKSAVSHLEAALGVSVAASDDITGIDGDWDLEVGKQLADLTIEGYSFNLQCANFGTAPAQDFDCDGVINSADLDDDNDGILDTDEGCADFTPFMLALDVNDSEFTDSGAAGDIGDNMRYNNIGTFNGTNVDFLMTVTGNTDPANMNINISGYTFATILYPIHLEGSSVDGVASFNFEFFETGTNTPIEVAPNFMFKDIDFVLTTGESESVEIESSLLRSYASSSTPVTDLVFTNVTTDYTGTNGNFLRVTSNSYGVGIANENLWASVQLLETDSFNVNFKKRDGNTGYVFNSDSFASTPNTTILNQGCNLDTDNDGTPDYLDTDSDNDGCPDAIEGAGLVLPTSLNANGNILGAVNANGVPTSPAAGGGNGQANTTAVVTAERITVATAPANQSVATGANATFNVSATSTSTTTFNAGTPNYTVPPGTTTTGSLTYKWYKNSAPNTTLSTTSSLTITNVQAANAGDYSVEIKNTNNSCPEIRTATLTACPVAVNTTSTASITENQTKTLTGTPSGGTWSIVSGGGTISGTTYTPANVTSNTQVTIRYTIAASGTCAASTSDVTFTVTPCPVASNTVSTATITGNGTKTLTGAPAGGTWTIVSGGGSINAANDTYTAANVTSTTTVVLRYTIAASGTCAASTSDVTFLVEISCDITPSVIAKN